MQRSSAAVAFVPKISTRLLTPLSFIDLNRRYCYCDGTLPEEGSISDIMVAFYLLSPAEIVVGLAERMKRRRIDFGLTQRELAARANVSYASLRLFETRGKISLESLVKIAFALEAEAEFEQLFPSRPPKTIDDVVDRPVRQRVRRK